MHDGAGPAPAGLAAVRLSDIARTVLAKRYLRRDESGKPVESAEDLYWRVARAVAETDGRFGAESPGIDRLAQDFYDLMASRAFLPNSPTLMNAGRPLGQLSACFVLPIEDVLSNGRNGIYDSLRAMALIHQSGGGTGFSFSRIRPEGDPVRSTTGVASGPVSFMRLYDASTDVVKQGGTRRGANMAVLSVDHPDIRDFIGCKADTSKITNFNISVALTDAFMSALVADEEYAIVHPVTGEIVRHESAAEIFELIVDGAWSTGEPGVFFIDRANAANPVPHIGSYEATNPCGEQPLLPYDVCNLGSVNLGLFARDADPACDPRERIDRVGLGRTVRLAVHFLDNVIDANRYPLPEIASLAGDIRRIGLGVMGWADLLIRLGVSYGTEDAVSMGREVMRFIEDEARLASEELAAERGPFPAWERSVWGPDATCARRPTGERIRPERRLRNCNLTTVAPTGSISMIAGCSGGIEPLFAVAIERRQAGETMLDVNEDFVRLARGQGWYSDDLMRKVAAAGHAQFPEVPESAREVFVTAHEIAPEWHVRMQAAFQEHVDAAISKTTNFPRQATVQDVRTTFELAYELGCKGVTVYRDGSRPHQALSAGAASPREAEPPEKVERERELLAKVDEAEQELNRVRERLEALEREREGAASPAASIPRTRKRPSMLRGWTVRMNSPLGDLYVTINEEETGQPFEMFCTLGKAGGAAVADSEAIGRLISLALRSGIPIERVRRQLRGISCDRAAGVGTNKVLSVPDAIAQAITRYVQAKEEGQEGSRAGAWADVAPAVRVPGRIDSEVNGADHSLLGHCPDCGSGQLAFEEGCLNCHICGYSECG